MGHGFGPGGSGSEERDVMNFIIRYMRIAVRIVAMVATHGDMVVVLK